MVGYSYDQTLLLERKRHPCRAQKERLQPFLDAEQPDVLCLQETKAKQEQVELELPGYRQFWYSADKAGYSGTAIFSKAEPLQVVNGFPKTSLASTT